jgi:diphthamide biosynthesis protein 3
MPMSWLCFHLRKMEGEAESSRCSALWLNLCHSLFLYRIFAPFVPKESLIGTGGQKKKKGRHMTYHYDEVRLDEMEVDGDVLRHPCPCGDLFEMQLEALARGSDTAQCPTCSLTCKVVYSAAERSAFFARIGRIDILLNTAASTPVAA